MSDFSSRLRVVLVRPRNLLNIGAAARAISNFGIGELRLVAPYETAWREARSAVGAAAVLEQARAYDALPDAVADCSLVAGTASMGGREVRTAIHRLESGGKLLRRHLESGAAAILFGQENHGLSNEDLSQCHWLMRIPTREEHESMNLGQAVAVCLYELVRDPEASASGPRAAPPATTGHLARLEALLKELLADCGYTHDPTTPSGEAKLGRLLRRMAMSGEDARIWMGMVRQIRWKLRDLGSRPHERPKSP